MTDDFTPAEIADRDQALTDLDDPMSLRYPQRLYLPCYDVRDGRYKVIRRDEEIVGEFATRADAEAFIEAEEGRT